MQSRRFNARLDKCHLGPQHPFKNAGVVAGSLTGMRNAMKWLIVVNTQGLLGVPIGKNPRGLKSGGRGGHAVGPPLSHKLKKEKKLRGLHSASELYRLTDRRLSAKLVPTFAERG
jgi:hypothetical protein